MDFKFDFIKMINDNTIMELIDCILPRKDNIKHLQLNISSLGGSMPHAIAIYNFLKNMPFSIKTHNLAEVTSAAVILYLVQRILSL